MIQLQTFSSLASISLTDSESAASRVIVHLARIEEFAQKHFRLDDGRRRPTLRRRSPREYLLPDAWFLCVFVYYRHG